MPRRNLKKIGMGFAMLALVCLQTAQAATITVTSREDSGPGTLRQAIVDATAGDTIDFAVPGNNSITVYSRLTVNKQLTIDGGGVQVVGANSAGFNVIELLSGTNGTIIRNLAVVGGDVGIYVSNSNNFQILGCRLGTDWLNTSGRGCNRGLQISNAWGGAVGLPGQGNVISGNNTYGIYTSASGGYTIQGNYIGTNSTGTAALSGQDYGIYMLYGSSVTIGGDRASGEGNLVSGNTQYGMYLGTGTGTTSNIAVAGNVVGLNATESGTIPNATGIRVGDNAGSMSVGLPQAGRGNIVAGNSSYGIYLPNVDGVTVQNNLIGVNSAGVDFGNGGSGLALSSSFGNLIGGRLHPAFLERNVISGNNQSGVYITGSSYGNTISGNFLGTDLTGNSAVANGNSGIEIANGTANLIGGASADSITARGNLISGNTSHGAFCSGGSANGFRGNWVGLNLAGDAALPNGNGITLSGCSYYEVGSTTASEGNVVAGNGNGGVFLTNGTGHTVAGNLVGTDPSGLNQISNVNLDLELMNADSCLIGGDVPGAGNRIAGQRVALLTDSDGNTITGNTIGVLADGSAPPSPIDYALWVDADCDHNWIGLPNGAGNLIARAEVGVYLASATADSIGLFSNTIVACSVDPVFFDSGANNDKAAPAIHTAWPTYVSGTAGAFDYIEVFKAEDVAGQGGSYGRVGYTTANSAGHWTVFAAGLVVGDRVTAMTTDNQNNTSDFCDNQVVQPAPTPTITPTGTVTPTITPTPVASATPTATPTSPLAGVDLGGKSVLAYPNPAKDRMTFVFHLDAAARVEIHLYNLAGEQVAALSGNFAAGRGQSLVWNLADVAPGVYVCRMAVAGGGKAKIKVAVVK